MTRFSLWAFIGVGLLIIGAIHYYLWARLVADAELPRPAHRALSVLFVALACSVPATFFSTRSIGEEARKLVLMPAFAWIGIVFILFSCVVGLDLLRLIGSLAQYLVRDLPPEDPERRVTLARLAAGGILLLTGAATFAGLREALGEVAVKEVAVKLSRLPRALDRTTIVQLSDIHVGPTIRADFVRRIVEQVNALEPDVVAITGDLVDGPVRQLREHVAPLANLRTKHGVYFVTGNHEYYSGVDSWCQELGRMGIRVLRNERVSIGDGDQSFDLAGIDDYHASRFGNGHGADLARAIAGRDSSRELVLLAHQPRAVFEADRHGVGLQLSGHTHGGQIWPWNYLVKLQQPVVSGLARIGRTLVYVSNGTGYWGPPMRLRAPAEVTRLILRALA